MKLHQLRALLAINDAGSIRLAARSLNVTQPALSKSISELEKELGIPLLNRSSSGATITSWGRSILERCRTIETEIQSIGEDAASLRENWSGRLRLGIIAVAAGPEIAAVLRSLRSRFPGIQISIHELRPQTVTQFVRDGIIDVGITTTVSDNSPNLISSELICHMDYVVVSSKETIGSLGDRNRLEELTEYPWVNASENQRSASHFFEIFDRVGVRRPTNWINCSSPNIALELVREDGFLCLWPERAYALMRDRIDSAGVGQIELAHPPAASRNLVRLQGQGFAHPTGTQFHFPDHGNRAWRRHTARLNGILTALNQISITPDRPFELLILCSIGGWRYANSSPESGGKT